MNRTLRSWATAISVLLLLVLGPAGGAQAEDGAIEVVVSPNVLNLESSGGSVSLHTDIAYGLADGVALTVDGVPVLSFTTFPDNRGQLVVKCNMATIKAMLDPGAATFDLTVTGTDGVIYAGTDTIQVISQAGVGRKGSHMPQSMR